MKIIVAGFPKTGTKSMKAALTELGFNVYDIFETFAYLEKEWKKICLEGGTTEDFRLMFENVDAVTDIPGCNFWDEIHKAFPDAKIILTMRENEEEWSKSMLNQLQAMNRPILWFLNLLAPTCRRIDSFANMTITAAFGTAPRFSLFSPVQANMSLMRMAYQRHNSHVMQTAPKEKLLVYNVKEGWGPLCKFLNLHVPNKPVPHKNIRGKFVDDSLQNNPLIIRAKRELIVSITCLILLIGYSGYKLYKSPPFNFGQAATRFVEIWNFVKTNFYPLSFLSKITYN